MAIDASSSQDYQGLRPYLFTVAYRMTGSASDAEDLVQDAWVRYLAAGSPEVDSLRAYLITIVSRLTLDYLKSARTRREQYVGPWIPEPVLTNEAIPGPAEIAEQREAVSIAFLMLLERLTPDQRVVYVLREAFEFSYDEIAHHLDKAPAACRQIFHRAELRLDAGTRPAAPTPRDELQSIAERFVAALSSGNASALAQILTPDVEWLSDAGGQRLAVRRLIRGRDKVSRGLAGFARKRLATAGIRHEIIDLNGSPAIVMRHGGGIAQVTVLEASKQGITGIRNLMNPDKLRHLAESLGADVAPIGYRPAPRAQPPAR